LNPASSNPSRSSLLSDAVLLAGFCGFLFFFGLSYFGLLGADEPRYAQVAQEMLARHDWITPTLGGKPWLEKPALYYWQTILAYKVFGVGDWAARLCSAMDATLMVIAIYLFLRRSRTDIQPTGIQLAGFPLDGALMTASASGVIGFARAASMDMPLAATFTVAILGWYVWYESGGKRYLALFYIFMGLAVLAKGPVAPFLVAVIVVIFAAAKGDYRLITRTLWIPGIVLFCVVALPWYIAVQLRNPEFFRVFILEHNLGRFGKDVYHHTEPIWYYLPVALLGLVPWTIFVAAAIGESVRACWKERREAFRSGDSLSAFLVIWLVVPIVFFSFSASKLPGYILLALPAGTLLLAEYVRRRVLERVSENARPKLLLIVLHSMVAGLPVVAALMMQYIVLQHRLPWGRAAAISFALAAALAAGIAATLRRQFGLRVLRFVTLVPVVLAVAAVLRLGAPALDATLSARPLSQEINRVDNRSLPLAILRLPRETEYGLQFYRNQSIVRYELGQIPDGEHLLVAREGWQKNIPKWTAGRRVTYLGSFAAQGFDYYWVAGKSN
jgi:4-amino-4-deoxy-L-arabinose transferase-like glycosyltransferase